MIDLNTHDFHLLVSTVFLQQRSSFSEPFHGRSFREHAQDLCLPTVLKKVCKIDLSCDIKVIL